MTAAHTPPSQTQPPSELTPLPGSSLRTARPGR